MRGAVAVLLWPLLRGQLARALKLENQGLKRYCESSV